MASLIEDRISTAPLRPFLRNRSWAGTLYEQRFGLSRGSGILAVNRVLTQETMRAVIADRWCVVLGVHLSQVYPSLYGRYDYL